eukprot:scaffold36811_cov63-Phaeocystis_antarctica.AAC.1
MGPPVIRAHLWCAFLIMCGGGHVNGREKSLARATKKPPSTSKSLLEPRAFSDPPPDCKVDRARRPSTVRPLGSERSDGPVLSSFE